MARLVRFSPYNPIQFVKQNDITPDSLGYAPFGKALHRDSLRYWQDDTPWLQPWNRSHLVNLQVGATFDDDDTAGTWVNIQVIAATKDFPDGVVLQTITSTDSAQIFTDEETGALFYTYLFSFTFGSYAALDSYTEIQVQTLIHHADGTDVTFISNPISLATRHEGVSWIEYNQFTNQSDTVFEQMQPRFGLPFYSKGMTWGPGGERTVYSDQNQALQMLYGKAYSVFTLDIGGFHGIPDTEMRLLNTILTEVEKVRIDGVEYTKEDAGLENAGTEGKAVQWRRATLRMADESESYTHGEKSYLLWTRPVEEDEPYAIMNLGVTDNFASIWEYKLVFDDAAAEDAYVTAFNSEASSKNMDCEIQEVDGGFYLVNTGTQRVYPYSTVLTFGGLQILSVTITGGLGSIAKYQMSFPTVGTTYLHVVSWGATSGNDEAVAADTTTAVATAQMTLAAGTHTVRIFHRNDFTSWWSVGTSFGGQSFKINNVTGETSSILGNFRLQNHDLSALTTFDLSFLAPAKNKLQFLTIENSGLKGITAGWASSLVAGTYKPFPLLGYYALGTNEWTVANLNAFVNEVRDSVKWSWYGNMFLKGNSPLAAPTGTALSNINDWKANWGWNILHD